MDQTFAFYRILGNDLPPRHGTRQTIDSLRFILDHEPAFAGCEKRWIINRITDAEREAEIIGLLDERKQTYRRIPFHLEEYARLFLDADGLPPGFNLLRIATGNTPTITDLDVFEWIHRRKNLYTMNINAARNLAIADGLASGARWIMPWDGQCCLTSAAFDAIRELASSSPHARYLIVSMARLADNRTLLQPGFKPEPDAEPQVVFRNDASERFDELMRYANGNKVELIARIGGPKLPLRWAPWEPPRHAAATNADLVATGGWVGRLAPAVDEKSTREGDFKRWISRFAGVSAHCATLDLRLVRAAREKSALICYAPFLGAAASPSARAAVATAAEKHLAASSPLQSLEEVIVSVTALALAAEVTADAVLAEHAARLVRAWFVEGRRTNPARQPTIVDLRDLWAFGDALLMLARAGKLTAADVAALNEWFRALAGRLRGGDGAMSANDHFGIFHDVLVASVGAYLDDMPLAAYVLARAPLRIHRQIQPGGWQQSERAGAAPLHRTLFGLQGLIALAWLGRNCGIDLWGYAGANHRSIPMAARFVAQNRTLFSDYAADPARFDARVEMALRAIPADAADSEVIAGLPRQAIADPAQLGAADGFAPLWPVLLATEDENAGRNAAPRPSAVQGDSARRRV